MTLHLARDATGLLLLRNKGGGSDRQQQAPLIMPVVKAVYT